MSKCIPLNLLRDYEISLEDHLVSTPDGDVTAYEGDYIITNGNVCLVLTPEQFNAKFSVIS